MKQIYKFLILVVTLIICACGPKLNHSNGTLEPSAALIHFSAAEGFFQRELYVKALKSYTEYLDQFPNTPSSELALMRIATIYSVNRKVEAKRMAYKRLITEYPNSGFVPDAMLEILVSFYNEGKLKQVVLQASEIIEKIDSKSHLFRTYTILGDAYISSGASRDAIFFYSIAHQISNATQKKSSLATLKAAISKLHSEDIFSLLRTLDDELPKSYLLYQLSINKYEKESYVEALKLFSEFIEKYPSHEKAIQAKNLREEIYQKTAFQRHLIGCLLPLSGPYRAFGKRALRGIELALGYSRFQIIVKDTSSDPKQAIGAVRYLDEKQVALIIGPIATSEAAAQESQKRGIPIITLTQKADVSAIGNYVFRNFLTPEMQIETIVPFVIEKLGIMRFAVLYPDENYGHAFMKVFRDKILDYGAEITGIESYHPNQTDFALPISKLAKFDLKDKRSNSRSRNHKANKTLVDFDAVFIPDSSEKAGMIASQLAFYDIDRVMLLGTNLWHSDNLIKEAGKYVQQALITDGFYRDTSKATVNDFIMAFKEQYGNFPGIIEAFAYETALIAIKASGNPTIRSRQELKNELKNVHNFSGVTGLTSFNENGDAEKKLYLLQIVGNKFVEVNRN